MARHTSVSLPDHVARFVDRQVDDGRYGSASDVVQAGLRLLEERETKLHAIRAALAEGEGSDDGFEAFETDSFLAAKRAPQR